jgi:circadian clock protein KaiC
LEEINAKRIFVDSISNFQLAFRDKDQLRERVYKLINYMKSNGLTSIFTHEIPVVMGDQLKISDYGFDFIVDSIIYLRLVETESQIKKALSILKMRGSNHDKELREYEITPKGICVKERFKDYEGIMTGSMRKLPDSRFADAFKFFSKATLKNGRTN